MKIIITKAASFNFFFVYMIILVWAPDSAVELNKYQFQKRPQMSAQLYCATYIPRT